MVFLAFSSFCMSRYNFSHPISILYVPPKFIIFQPLYSSIQLSFSFSFFCKFMSIGSPTVTFPLESTQFT